MNGRKKSSLSASNQRLINLMSSIGFGRVENLLVRAGEPAFDPPPRVVRERLLGSDSQPRPGIAADFALRKQVAELVEALAELGDGVVQVLEIRHGLPFRIVTEEPIGPQRRGA